VVGAAAGGIGPGACDVSFGEHAVGGGVNGGVGAGPGAAGDGDLCAEGGGLGSDAGAGVL